MGRGPGVGPVMEVDGPPGAAPAGAAVPVTERFHPRPGPAAGGEGAVAWVWFMCLPPLAFSA